MIAGVKHGYTTYKGWSKIENEIILPEVMCAINLLLTDPPDSIYSIGPGADPAHRQLTKNYKIIGIDKYKEQLIRAQSIGIQTIKGDLLNLQELNLDNLAKGIVPLVFVMHNLYRGELQKATSNLAQLCSVGTAILFLDPYCEGPYDIVLGDIKREAICSKTKLKLEPDKINPSLDEFIVKTHLNHGSSDHTIIEHDNHPLHEYITALETNGFGDISIHLIPIHKHPCYQIITARLKRK